MHKLLNCASRVVSTLGIYIRLMGFLRRCVVTKPMRFFIDGDAGSPLVLKPNNAQKSRFVAPIGAMKILRVSTQADDPQIAKPVVVFAPVNVVNQAARPFAVNVQPRQSMGFVDLAAKTYSDVAKFVAVTCYVANVNSFGRSLKPSKLAGVFVVMQKVANFICRDLMCSHAKPPLWGLNLSTEITK